MDLLGDLFIRPKKTVYKIEDLGPSEFEWPLTTMTKAKVMRHDFQVFNPVRRIHLQCSVFSPDHPSTPHHLEPSHHTTRFATPHTAILYLHGNAGSRLDALEALPLCLAFGWSLCCFDFGACGQSEGEFITLSDLERSDVDAVVDYICQPGKHV